MLIRLRQVADSDSSGYIKDLPDYIEIKGVEELFKLTDKYGEDIIVHRVNPKGWYDKPTVSIYNDYIE